MKVYLGPWSRLLLCVVHVCGMCPRGHEGTCCGIGTYFLIPHDGGVVLTGCVWWLLMSCLFALMFVYVSIFCICN